MQLQKIGLHHCHDSGNLIVAGVDQESHRAQPAFQTLGDDAGTDGVEVARRCAVENHTREIRARFRGGVGRFHTGDAADFNQDSHRAPLIGGARREIKQRPMNS